MIPISYPKNIEIIESYYVKRLKEIKGINVTKIDSYLNKIMYKNKRLCFEDLLIYPLNDLIKIIDLIEHGLSALQKKRLNRLFKYKSHQNKIADFFMNISGIELNTCYYCNIDYINPFVDMKDYGTPLFFINNSNLVELQSLVGVGKVTAQKIINQKPTGGYKKILHVKSLSVKSRILLRFFNFNMTHNHFTLDHVISQSKSKFLSLCFYNFVPSCYSCNSKFKGDKEFAKKSDLIHASPTSEKFSINTDITFKIYFKKELKKIEDINDFRLVLESSEDYSEQYKSMFKLDGRYGYHKKIVPNIIKNKLNYPDSRIEEISAITGIQEIEIKKTIFGEELFNDELSCEPLVKLKRDIAEQISIKGVLKKKP